MCRSSQGKVHLPITVSKEAVQHELKRFGLDVTAEQRLGAGVRIVQDGVAFPAAFAKVTMWKEEAAEDLLGTLIAEAACEKLGEAQGQPFQAPRVQAVERKDVAGGDCHRLGKILRRVELAQLNASEALKDGGGLEVVPGGAGGRPWGG
eukprot:Skav230260  [mRNA]  locus=scaffold3387:106644:112046:+ [translate_table: standard]